MNDLDRAREEAFRNALRSAVERVADSMILEAGGQEKIKVTKKTISNRTLEYSNVQDPFGSCATF
jgi:hypothetical protein